MITITVNGQRRDVDAAPDRLRTDVDLSDAGPITADGVDALERGDFIELEDADLEDYIRGLAGASKRSG